MSRLTVKKLHWLAFVPQEMTVGELSRPGARKKTISWYIYSVVLVAAKTRRMLKYSMPVLANLLLHRQHAPILDTHTLEAGDTANEENAAESDLG